MISPQDKNALIAWRIEQAEKCISDAEYNLADGRVAVATNRVYYGMLYAYVCTWVAS